MEDDYAEKLTQLEGWVCEGEDGLDALLLLEARPSYLWVENIAVRPGRQGTGIGRALLDVAEGRARELGRGEMRLLTHETMVENQAIYRHLGWSEVEPEARDGHSRVWFRKRLDPDGG